MKVLFLPYLDQHTDLDELDKFINSSSMKIFIVKSKRKNECATVSYSLENNKIIISKDCEIEKSDIIKEKFENIGDGISRGAINGKRATWIVCYKRADLSEMNIDEIVEFIKQENIKNGI